MTLKLLEEDNGNCRVYYRGDAGALYCYQLATRDTFAFYRCSRDGEPSHEVDAPTGLPLPKGETSIGRELIAFLKA